MKKREVEKMVDKRVEDETNRIILCILFGVIVFLAIFTFGLMTGW